MEDKNVNIIAVSTVIILIVVIVIARVSLKLSKAFHLIAGADVAVIFAVLVCLMIRLRYNRRRQLLVTQLISEGRELRIEYSFLRKVAGVPIKFRFKELEEATEKPRLRPTMASVVEMLEDRVAVVEPPDTQMIVIDLLSIDGDAPDGHKSATIAALAAEQLEETNPTVSCSYTFSVVSGR
ncbi:hypothetical protein GH714_041290 [Hevea brasiliensis]|uniref:Uncharacterized protein n=1 Tax=Hevea brasiliensis TaxID=3981 RepID=A0A6A6N094_HEVBR|nr:hypothetical protein GH714_041290 [Hevea brasiliensis]